MSLINRMRKRDATYWKLVGHDASGQEIYDSPIPIKVRWDDVAELYMTASGEQKVSNAKVYVDRKMPEGSVLLYQKYEDVVNLDDPLANEGAFQIKAFQSIDNLRATETLRIAIL